MSASGWRERVGDGAPVGVDPVAVASRAADASIRAAIEGVDVDRKSTEASAKVGETAARRPSAPSSSTEEGRHRRANGARRCRGVDPSGLSSRRRPAPPPRDLREDPIAFSL